MDFVDSSNSFIFSSSCVRSESFTFEDSITIVSRDRILSIKNKKTVFCVSVFLKLIWSNFELKLSSDVYEEEVSNMPFS